MASDTSVWSRPVPIVAAALAFTYLLAAMVVPILLAPLVIASVIAGCAVALTRRGARPLVLSTAAIGIWLVAASAGTWLLRGELLRGLLWVVAAFFVVPLPLVPWLYSRTFPPAHGPRPTAHASKRDEA